MITKTEDVKETRQIGTGQSQSSFQQANFEKALEERKKNSNRYYKEQQVKYLVNLGHFKMYGMGVYLFFSFIKHAIILFAILTIVSIAPIVLNAVKGSTFRHNQNSLSLLLTKSSLGSHKYSIMVVNNAYNLSITFKVVNAVFDIISCLIFLIFCLYWQRKSKKIQKHIQKQIKLQSNFTVQAIQFPKSIGQSQMQSFMRRFGSVKEVVAARDFTKQIELSKNIYQNQLQIKQLQLQIGDELRDNKDQSQIKRQNQKKISQLCKQNNQLLKQLDEIKTRPHEIQRFYIQFQSTQQRNMVVKQFAKYQTICSCFKQKPENMQYQGEDVKIVACNTQPAGVIWENAHVTWRDRLPRNLLQLFIILSIIVGGFVLISFLNILVPQVDSDMNTNNISFDRLRNIRNTTVIQAWCNNNYVLISPQSSPYFPVCQKYWQLYTHSVIISLSISVIVMIICQIITKIVYALVSYQKYTTKSQQSVTIMTNLFIMNFLTSTFITFLMQADIFGLSVMNFMRMIITSPDLRNNINSIDVYKDLIPRWYKDIGYQIWFNMFVMIFLPQLTQPIFTYLKQVYSLYSGKKQKVHVKMVKSIQCPEFDIQSLYSQVLLIISTGMIFGGGIQLMMIVVFACMFVRYFYYKFMFIRFCKVPYAFNQLLNQRLIRILKIILVVRLLISIYMYGAEDVFAMEKSSFMIWANSLSLPVLSSIFIVLSRILLTWYYSIFALLFMLVLIFQQPIFAGVDRFKRWRKQQQQANKQMTESSINPTMKTQNQMLQAYPSVLLTNSNGAQNNRRVQASNTKQLVNNNLKRDSQAMNQDVSIVQSWATNENQEVRTQVNLVHSYRLENNPNYQEILHIMKLNNRRSSYKSNQVQAKKRSRQVTVNQL